MSTNQNMEYSHFLLSLYNMEDALP